MLNIVIETTQSVFSVIAKTHVSKDLSVHNYNENSFAYAIETCLMFGKRLNKCVGIIKQFGLG
jgi:hypothetical protein